MKIVILERGTVGADTDISALLGFGSTDVYDNSLPEEVAGRVAGADIVIANKMPLNEKTLYTAPELKLIAEFATGYDNIDLDYCRAHGIAVCNVSGYSTDCVAQHTFAMALSLLEHLPGYDDFVKSGKYSAQGRFTWYGLPFSELSGMTWGIAGMGNIGRRVAEIAKAFGCRVVYWSSGGSHEVPGYQRLELDELLSESDVLSLHCPLNDKTRHLINGNALSKMKSSAILINVARGAVVDTAALAKALDAGVIAGAGIDVMEKEPVEADHPLLRLEHPDRLIITPHVAWAGREARQRVVDEAYANIKAFLEGGERSRII